MEFIAKTVEKVSKNGQPYVAIEIELVDGYKKLVFLTPAEKALIERI